MKHRFFSDDADDDPEERPFWQQRGWQVSAAFFAVMLVAGTVIALGGGPDAEAEPVAAAGPLSGGITLDGGRPAGCRTDDSAQSTPVRPPDDVTWQPLNGSSVPLSASAGPLRSSGPVMWCYAHTPMGAVMAAHVIPRHMSGKEWRTITDQQVVPGVGRDIFVAMRSSLEDVTPQYTASSLAGFVLMSYSPEAATVRLLIRLGPAGLGVTDYALAWSGGDWKVRPLSSGDLHTPVSPVPAATGFVLWPVS